MKFETKHRKNPPRPAATLPVEGIRENPPRPASTPPMGMGEEKPTPACGHPSDGGDTKIYQLCSKEIPSCGGVPERRGGSNSTPAEECRNVGEGQNISKRGAALIVVMWVLVIVAMIVSTFAFEMQLEARIISAQRKRFKADQLALAGIEMAKAMLAFKPEAGADKDTVYEDPYLNEAAKIVDGVPANYSEDSGDGTVTLRVNYEKGRRYIRTMTHDDWKMLFEQAGVPNTRWDSLLDCLDDWQDEGDLHLLNGAESDDPFYRKRGYECKNAPVDTVDELLLIKGWTPEILYGTQPGEETDRPIAGIARQLTTWGDDNKVNPNSASREVLNSLNISDGVIDAILEMRLGPDGKEGTADDGMSEADIASLGQEIFTAAHEYVSVTSVGTVGGVESQISCIFKLGDKEVVPLFWSEGKQ